MTEPLLTIRNLVITGAGDAPIVDGVDLDLRAGEVLGLVGESGAGKSTLGLAAMGYCRGGCHITGGSIRFRGEELRSATPRRLRALRGRHIAYVAQSAAASFNPAQRLIEQFVEGPVQHGTSDRATALRDGTALFAEMQLPDPQGFGLRYPHEVSGGQLQRAMTCMAMACRPDLIIFDEPTTALDVTTQVGVLAAIRRIVAEYETAAIYITHDLAVVAQMADRIMVLRHGKTIEVADTQAMLTAPTQDYTRSLWAVRSLRRPARAAPEGGPLLEISGVSAHYGQERALDEVSVSIPRGRTLAVVGESGSGKSTLARVITGILPASAGRILWKGAPLPPRMEQRDRSLLRPIQMIYQMPDTALNPRHNVREVIGRPLTFFQGLRGAAKEERLRALMQQIELDPDTFLDRRASALSGGQKQRIGIARALAAGPEFIICDEVTSSLDQLVAEGILRLLMRLQEELGLTYMFITHDLATVRAIADDVVVMRAGRVVEAGPRDRIFSPPHTPYTAELLSSVPEMDPEWLTRLLAARAATP